jgi:hypothetical protein
MKKALGYGTVGLAVTVAVSLGGSALAVASNPTRDARAASPAVSVVRSLSSCVPLPSMDKGIVRFFFQIKNTGGTTAGLHNDIHPLWRRYDGSWKDSWVNTLTGSDLKVPAYRGKRYWADFGADPSKPIIACGFRLGAGTHVYRIRVIR